MSIFIFAYDHSECSMSTLLLITSAPTSMMAWHAFGLAQALQNKHEEFRVFFYQDGVQVANDLQWFPDDQRNLKLEWQKLGVRLPVCVSAALARESLMPAMHNVIQFSSTTWPRVLSLLGLENLLMPYKAVLV